jgi:predicted enzyme related to lactoylglutathione lyase
MTNPVVHFEIIGKDPSVLAEYYDQLFAWKVDMNSPVAPEISQEGNYGFIDKITTDDGTGIPGGIGGGNAFTPHSIFYVGVPDVEAALTKAQELGGTRILGPVVKPGGGLVVGHFADPEGTVIGVAGPK